MGLLLTATYFQQFDFGTSELKFILDFSFGAVLFFGSVLTVVITTQIFFNEIEHRTAISILSRAISRWEFLLGKLFGIATLLFFFCLSTGILLSFLLGIKASELARESNLTENLVNQIEIFQFLGLQWLKFIVLTAMTLCIAGFSRSSLYTIVVTFLAILVCQLQH
ncbi:MAG: ABC transporter permease subunit, partial [Opitutae bacterium]|nr:ABC transporter permease subunit [Opitutae bacterium]